MFEVSVTTVVLVIVILFVFRSNIKQLTAAAPKIANSVISPAVRAAAHIDHVVATNCNESVLELVERNIVIKEQLDAKGIKSVEDLNKLIKFLD